MVRFNNIIGIIDDDKHLTNLWFKLFDRLDKGFLEEVRYDRGIRDIEGVKYRGREYTFSGFIRSLEEDPDQEAKPFLNSCPGMCFISLEYFVNKSLDIENHMDGSWRIKKKLEQGKYKDLEISDNPVLEQILEVIKKRFQQHGEIYFVDTSLKKYSEIFEPKGYSGILGDPAISRELFEEYFSEVPLIRDKNKRSTTFIFSLFGYHEWAYIRELADHIKESYKEDTSFGARLKDRIRPESRVDRIIRSYTELIPEHEQDHKVIEKYYDRLRCIVRNPFIKEIK